MQLKRVIVFGASGGTGRPTARLAKETGNEVIAVIRKPEQAADFHEAGIETALFDISSAAPEAYVKLFQQVQPDTVIWAAGVDENHPSPRKIEYDAQVNVYNAMKEVGIRRVIVVSSSGIWKEGTAWPEWFDEDDKKLITEYRGWVPKIVEAKFQAEAHLRSLKELDWTILRPAHLSNEPAKGVKMGKVGVIGMTPRELVAEIIVASINEAGMIGRTIDILPGDKSVEDEIRRVVELDIDTWVGEV